MYLRQNYIHKALADNQASIDANPIPYYMAALEAMDTEMGRLLNSMSQEEKDNILIILSVDPLEGTNLLNSIQLPLNLANSNEKERLSDELSRLRD